jgi:hypothetical protein
MSYTAPSLPSWGHSIDTATGAVSGIPIRAAPGDNQWPTNDLAIYVPFAIGMPVRVLTLWFANGSVGTDNYDIGLFNAAGTKLASSGATAKAAGAAETVANIADTLIGPGLYYIGLSSASTASSFTMYSVASPIGAAFGVKQEASAHPLPATATMVNSGQAYIPLVGMLIDATVT